MAKSAAIIGLGGIGMVYDLNLPNSVLSHARSLSKHLDFELVGAVDPDGIARGIFTDRYGGLAFATVAELINYCRPEVVVIATPTDTHLAIIQDLLERHKPKIILCEKPLAYCEEDAKGIVDLCELKGVGLFINYIRRADPAVIEVKSRLLVGEIALPFKAVVWYSKGLIHNGSHFLDILIFWFGPVQSLKLIDRGRDLGLQDAEPDFQVEFECGTAVFCAANEDNFSHYTIEILARNGRLRYEQGGIVNWQAAGQHPTLENYRQLQITAEVIDNDMSHYQYHVADQLSVALRGNESTLCAGYDGLKVVTWLTSLLNERSKN
jgi:predicted dehydrogenase